MQLNKVRQGGNFCNESVTNGNHRIELQIRLSCTTFVVG